MPLAPPTAAFVAPHPEGAVDDGRICRRPESILLTEHGSAFDRDCSGDAGGENVDGGNASHDLKLGTAAEGKGEKKSDAYIGNTARDEGESSAMEATIEAVAGTRSGELPGGSGTDGSGGTGRKTTEADVL